LLERSRNAKLSSPTPIGEPKISISNVATDKKIGMTFADLHTFVQDCMNRDLLDDAEIKVDVGWSQQIQEITKRARQEKGPRVMNSSGLLTRWIEGDSEPTRRRVLRSALSSDEQVTETYSISQPLVSGWSSPRPGVCGPGCPRRGFGPVGSYPTCAERRRGGR
jgi:hypothetical protein